MLETTGNLIITATREPAALLRRDGSASPLPVVEEVAFRDPIELLRLMSPAPGVVFLDSAMPHPALGRWSWLACDPFGRFTADHTTAMWNSVPVPGHPVAALRAVLRRFPQRAEATLPFIGGATGSFAYEAARLFERLPEPKPGGTRAPLIDLWFHDAGFLFDAVESRLFLVSTGWPEQDVDRRARRARERLDWLRGLLQTTPARRAGARICIARSAWQPNMNPATFQAAVQRTKRLITEGDIFQANIAQAFRAPLPPNFDPVGLYVQLRSANPAPFGALIVTPDRLIASTSPEGFLRLEEREVETRPIKGTNRRSSDPQQDRALAEELLASAKDRAENVMIVDLMRNDLSRVCLAGSVEVPVLCGLESYTAVHHLVSVVRGRLKPGLDALHLLAACFPGGSITGAPKIRAMEIIHELEPDPRGVYCGSIVHLGFDGSLRSSIAIRTLVAEEGTACIHTGGGITLLSDPEAEYAETLLKAERMLAAFDSAPAAEAAG